MRNTVLVTGGTGKTGRRIVQRLEACGFPVKAASRTANAPNRVRFDWYDATSFTAALENVRSVYLIAPADTTESLDAMRPFLEQAVAAGVERFVLLSSSSIEQGGLLMGQVHEWLAQQSVPYTVLRPSWFMQNFSESQHLMGICHADMIRSATGDGKVGFIDAEDIAAVAVEALTDPTFSHTELVLTGPAAISYDKVAQIISDAVGRPISHKRLDANELGKMFREMGVTADFADVLVQLDIAISEGVENRTTDNVHTVTGREAGGFEVFAQREASVWKVES